MSLKIITFLLALATSGWLFAASSNVPNLKGKEAFVQGEILVCFREGASSQSRDKAAALVGRSQSINHPTLVKIKLNPGLDVQSALAQVKDDPAVQYAQPNYRYYAFSCGPPTDQYYATPVPISGGTSVAANWPFTKIQAPQGWALVTSCTTPPGAGSSSVTVAVLDSGVSRASPDLRNVPAIGYNAVCDSQSQSAGCTCGASVTDFGINYASTDDFGHGTYVAGIIGAEWNITYPESGSCSIGGSSGIAGMAPGCILMAVKVLDCTGAGTSASLAMGINFAVAHGARVLNISLGSPYSDGLDPAVQAALDNALANNCVIVASSGNESRSGQLAPLDYPAAYPPVLSVGASDENDNPAFYSNGGSNLKMVAPGGFGDGALTGAFRPDHDILSDLLCPLSAAAVSEGGFVAMPADSNFGTAAGTSAAAPFVSGTAALVMSLYPSLTNTQVVQAIVNNTDSLNGGQGWSAQTGYGRLNVYQALLNANNSGGHVTQYLSTFNSPNPFYTGVSGTTNITIAVTQAAPVELTIYDTSGEVVLHKNFDASQLNSNPFNPQFKSFYVPWDGRNGAGQQVTTGIYFYTVKANGQLGRNKIAVIQGSK